MKRNAQILKLILPIYFLCITLTVFSQEGWVWQHPAPLGAPPTNVKIIDENTIYFVAGAGIFYKTTDGGESWDISYFNTTKSAFPPVFVNAQVGYIASSDGKVFKTIDGGDTWGTVYEDPNEFQFTAIDFYDENYGIVSAQKSFTDSKVLITKDGGQTWQSFDSSETENAEAIFYEGGIWEVDITSPDTMYARGGGAGTFEAFYRTYDGGVSWDTLEISIEGDTLIPSYMEALAFVNDTVGFVSGPGGGIYKTVDGGETWKRVLSQTPGEKYYLNNMFFLNEQKGWVAGFDNDFSSFTSAPLFETNDGGETWTEIDWVAEERFIDQIAFHDDSIGMAIGRMNGNVYQTKDGGQSWEAIVNDGFRGSLTSIDAIDEQNAWAVGAEGTILTTSNGGELWQMQNSGVHKTIRDVQFLNNQIGWAVGDSGTLIKTIDSGSNWNGIQTDLDENFHEIQMINPSDGWIVGDSSLVLKTTDGGSTWASISVIPGDTIQLNTIHFIDENKGWIGGKEGTILYTADGGDTWHSQSTDLLGFGINDFFFLDELNGWATCSGGTNNVFGQLIKTEDGGNTWVQVPTNYLYAMYEIHFINPMKGWITGYGFGGNHLLITNDGGVTWNTDTSLRSNRAMASIDFVNEGHGWVVGGSGSILKYYNLNLSNTSKLVLEKSQLKVYPNPSNGIFNVEIPGAVDLTGVAVVSLYNLEGRMLNIQSVDLKNGEITLDYSPDYLASGLYILNINVGKTLLSHKVLIR